MTKIPEHVQRTIRQRVYAAADEADYLDSNRTDNAKLLERLCGDPQIGGVLRQYLSRERIRTYVKDAVLNRYAKERKASLRPTVEECAEFCSRRFAVADFTNVDDEGKDIVLFKSLASPFYAVVVHGTCLKWETALRKALLFVATKPFGIRSGNTVQIVLSLCSRGTSLTPSDRQVIDRALARAGAVAYLWGDETRGYGDDSEYQIRTVPMDMAAEEHDSYTS